ncbi:YjfB family protein [Halobacillus shinanisalinarum]|uniref:YjfB family protein n=2 Tax=Halobacillus shinanisalinarum TaxID=2932258 RepID=A0ABY4H3A6_9BACI|nr:YjfB family protein [Halobacillus shinanisalinarum]
MSQAHVRQQASLAVMDKTMQTSEAKGNQMVQMLQQSVQPVPHPTHGSQIDLKG